MDSTRWERMQALFHEAAALPQSDQHIFLKSACGDDATLVGEVLAMLEEDGREASVLDRGMAQVADKLLDGDASSLSSREFGPYQVIRVLGEGGMGVVMPGFRPPAANVSPVNSEPSHSLIIPRSRTSTTPMHCWMAPHGLSWNTWKVCRSRTIATSTTAPSENDSSCFVQFAKQSSMLMDMR
jgi:hypothetical protein